MRTEISGVVPIVQTPFLDDDTIDRRTLQREIDWAFSVGADGLGIAMVSELPRLTADERIVLTNEVVAHTAGRGIVVSSVGAESTRQAQIFASAAQQAGCQAIMAAPPVATPLGEAALVDYFCALADEVDLPLVVQDASSYLGQVIPLSVYVRLLDRYGEEKILFKPEANPIGPNLTALRQASGGVARIFEGSGGIHLVDSFQRGIVGTMPGMDLLDGIVELWNALQAGEQQRIYQLSLPIAAIVGLQVQGGLDGFLAIEKYLLQRRGIFSNTRRRKPYSWELDSATIAEVDRLFDLFMDAVNQCLAPQLQMPAYVMLLLCGATVIAYVQRSAISVPAIDIGSELAVDGPAIGLVMSSWYWGYAAFQIPAGLSADRWGSRHVLMLALVAWSTLTLLTGLVASYWQLLVVWTLMGAAQAAMFPCATKIIGLVCREERRALASGLLPVSMSIGTALAPLMTGYLLTRMTWHEVFFLYGLPGLLWALLLLRQRDEPAAAAPRAPATTPGVSLSGLLLSLPMVLLCGQQFLRAAAMVFFNTWFPRFLQEGYQATQLEAARLTFWPCGAAMLGFLIGGFTADWMFVHLRSRWWSRQGIAVGGMLTCCGCCLVAWTCTQIEWVVGWISVGAFWASFGGVSGYPAAIEYGGRNVATVFSVMNMCGNIGAGLFPLTIAWLVEASHGWQIPLLVFASLFAGDALCWALFNPVRRRPPAANPMVSELA